jgi:hypothetical protein
VSIIQRVLSGSRRACWLLGVAMIWVLVLGGVAWLLITSAQHWTP